MLHVRKTGKILKWLLWGYFTLTFNTYFSVLPSAAGQISCTFYKTFSFTSGAVYCFLQHVYRLPGSSTAADAISWCLPQRCKYVWKLQILSLLSDLYPRVCNSLKALSALQGCGRWLVGDICAGQLTENASWCEQGTPLLMIEMRPDVAKICIQRLLRMDKSLVKTELTRMK